MTEADLGAVVETEQESFTVPWTRSTFASLLRRPDAHLWVAEDRESEAVVGHVVTWVVVDQAELGDIVVREAWRGRGLGQRLMDTVAAHVRAEGVRELFLEVRESNEAAQRLYLRNGFREVARRRNYYTRPHEDALVMQKNLADTLDD